MGAKTFWSNRYNIAKNRTLSNRYNIAKNRTQVL